MKNVFLGLALLCAVFSVQAQQTSKELLQLKNEAAAKSRSLNAELKNAERAYKEAQKATKEATTDAALKTATETELRLKEQRDLLQVDAKNKNEILRSIDKQQRQTLKEEKRLEKAQKKHEKEQKLAEKKKKRIEKAEKRIEKAQKKLAQYEKDHTKKIKRYESKRAKMNTVAELKAKKDILKAETKVEAQKMEIQKLEVALRVAHQ